MKSAVAMAVVVLVGAGTAACADPITRGKITASTACGECHRDIFRMWDASAHARALEDPIFQDAFRETRAVEGEAVARICLRCHAPIAEINKDSDLKQKVTWEGVNCDICHSLAAVELTPEGAKQVLDVGPVKRGPIRDAESSAHEVLYSELHTQSLVCAGCHEFVNGEGTPIMSTYTEWSGSEAAREGTRCQDCHMGRTQANVVDPRVARVSHAEVNLHEVPGGHSLDQLHKALRVAIDSRRNGDTLSVVIRIINKGAGHAVPTGMPGRRVMLDLGLRTSAKQSYGERRIYARTYLDAQGRTIDRDAGYFAQGVRLEGDTRIRPDEQRSEEFRFMVPVEATAYMSVKLHYEHAPTGGIEGRTYMTFLSEERVLLPKGTE